MGAALDSLLGLVVPPRCCVCGRSCGVREPLCAGCRLALGAARPLIETGPPGIEACWSRGAHDGTVRDVVRALKFARRLPLAAVAAEAMLAAAPSELLVGAVVPVPPDPLRIRVRGFDPAEEIAIAIARRTRLPLERCLQRAPGRRQVGRARAERVRHPLTVVAWRPAPSEAVLVDDVHTTGATLSACATALRRGGCRRVVALTLARKP